MALLIQNLVEAECSGVAFSVDPVPDEHRRAACLPEPWLRRIAQFVIAAENALGGPQHIEWAIRDNQVWLLESRPVTALPSGFQFGSSPFPISVEDRTSPLWELRANSRHRVPLPLDLGTESIRAASMAEALLINGRTWGSRLDTLGVPRAGSGEDHGAIHFALPDGQAFGEPFFEAFAKLTGCAKEAAREASFAIWTAPATG